MPRRNTKKVKLSDTQVFLSSLENYRTSNGQLDDYAVSAIQSWVLPQIFDLEQTLPIGFDLMPRVTKLWDNKVRDLKPWRKLVNDIDLEQRSLASSLL
tara:strand:- start:3183 stop:3476 length:294 start_codon:yes stop_codon:yes gene_type:complete